MPDYFRPLIPGYPQRPPLTEPQRRLLRDDVARWPDHPYLVRSLRYRVLAQLFCGISGFWTTTLPFSADTPEEKANYFLFWNRFQDRHGWIYALRQHPFDPTTGMYYEAIKYGLTSNLERRMEQYDDCFPTTWLFAWPTSCVKLTEALIHARLRSRGLGVGSFYCWCGHAHREFFWGWGIGDVCREVEEVLWDTAQPILRYWL
ncbi:hypothetical protein R3P38DRAFT_3548823 [Favolaschia claudopus]|uniref:Bacteriophage T5 Orf172 DNA-binding domain-containing protein n=1 Tax=Favolaschia claudopus TaxID=2862362 RepID=A0AAW0B3H0_9AGAR